MSLDKHQNGWVIGFSFILAYLLTIFPLAEWAKYWRPDWVALTLIYWSITLPQRSGVLTGWFAGLFLDVLTGTLLGQHALSLSLVAYFSQKAHQRLRIYPFHQQIFIIFALVLLAQLPSIWVRGVQNHPSVEWLFVYPAISSVLVWYWVYHFLQRLRLHFKVL
jgi:rod shape-determining protein MreD